MPQAMDDMNRSLEDAERQIASAAPQQADAASEPIVQAMLEAPRDASAAADGLQPVQELPAADQIAAEHVSGGADAGTPAEGGEALPAEVQPAVLAELAADAASPGGEGAEVQAEAEAAEPPEPPRPPVHAWVLILKGKRGVSMHALVWDQHSLHPFIT